MHFFNPAQIMKLVEVVHRLHADDVVATVQDLCAKVGKHAVRVGTARLHRQRPALPYLNDAVKMLQANYAWPTTSTPP